MTKHKNTMLFFEENVLIEIMNNVYILKLRVNLKGELLWVWDIS